MLEKQVMDFATNNFPSNNKLGQGGFGSVYKLLGEDESRAITTRMTGTRHGDYGNKINHSSSWIRHWATLTIQHK
ncbi:hypothetical protein V6N13_117253 [Hibiscus sabdariffa]|uniref:Protein kinase domain-containing protein n=1 Tax=Hibiscus sabdariffa TaxID=183260 RepID=A0ABR2PAS9_9ROSI